MTTFSDLVSEVRQKTQGFSLSPDGLTWLTLDVTSGATTVTVADGEPLSRGVAEIEDELVWIDSVDQDTRVVTIAPFGRGFHGTTAVSHLANSRVTMNPAYPAFSIKAAINDTINSFYPDLFAVKSTTLTSSPVVTTYGVPADLEVVLSITWDSIGPENEWYPIGKYRLDKNAPTSEYATGKSISIYAAIPPSRAVKVTYKAIPSVLTANADVFTTVTGLPESCRDLVALGASQRLTSYIDAGRLANAGAEADLADVPKPFGSGARASKDLFGFYTQRLRQEAHKLNARYPIKTYRTV